SLLFIIFTSLLYFVYASIINHGVHFRSNQVSFDILLLAVVETAKPPVNPATRVASIMGG
ncbi:MAG: hypothetical protein WBO75_04455, partial [Trichococcus flocculiformis]